jgi:Ca2+/Na+ antiporter
MDEKTTRVVRARIYIAFAVIAAVMAVALTGTIRRVALAATAVYCVVMAVVNFRKAKDEDGGEQ